MRKMSCSLPHADHAHDGLIRRSRRTRRRGRNLLRLQESADGLGRQQGCRRRGAAAAGDDGRVEVHDAGKTALRIERRRPGKSRLRRRLDALRGEAAQQCASPRRRPPEQRIGDAEERELVAARCRRVGAKRRGARSRAP